MLAFPPGLAWRDPKRALTVRAWAHRPGNSYGADDEQWGQMAPIMSEWVQAMKEGNRQLAHTYIESMAPLLTSTEWYRK